MFSRAMAGQVKCLYHYPCPDGITAALAAHLHHVHLSIPVQWVPHTTFAPLNLADLQLNGGETVYLLDYSGPPGFARQLAQQVKHCIVLDHHKTAAEDLRQPLPPNLEVVIDMNRSGAAIALDFFKPPGVSAATESFVSYIEDGDLWRWKLPASRAFYAGLKARKLEFDANKNPGIFDYLASLSPEQLIEEGEVQLEEQARWIDAAVAQAFVVDLGGAAGREKGWGQALAVKIEPEMATLRSELGNALAEAADAKGLRSVGAVAYREPGMVVAGMVVADAQLKISLRSIGAEEDTTVVTQAFGGGGHLNASACVVDVAEFASWKEA